MNASVAPGHVELIALQRLALGVAGAVLLALAALIGWAPTARAADPFTIANVRVEATGADAARARENALARARAQAWATLALRLAPSATAPAPAPDAATLASMAARIDVIEERRAATRHVGAYAIGFDRAQVRQYLRSLSLAAIEVQALPLIIAPELADGPPGLGGQWAQAWSRANFAHELQPLLLAPESAETRHQRVFASITWANGRAEATIRRENGQSGRHSDFVVPLPVDPAAAPSREALDRAVAEVAQALQNRWKRDVARRANERSELVINALYASAEEWRRMRNAISANPFLASLAFDLLSIDGAQIRCAFVGTIEDVVADFAEQGLRLDRGDGEIWIASWN